MKNRASYVTWLMPAVTALRFFLPRWLMVPAVRFIGRVVYRFAPKLRAHALANARHTLGPDAPDALVRATARRVLENLAVKHLDTVSIPVMKRRLPALADPHPRLGELLPADGRGGIIVTAHLGNWDLAGVYLTTLGFPLSAVVEPIPRGWTRTFNRYRCYSGLEAIPLPGHAQIADAVRRNRLLTLVADRDLTGHGLPVESFGGVRSFPKGPAAYALKYGLPLVIGCLLFQNRPGRPPYRAHVEPGPDFSPSGDMERDVANLTRLIAGRINRLIAEFPDQWLVFNAGWQ